jgi:hypothetical protein
MTRWLNREQQVLLALHRAGRKPTFDGLAAALPRHTLKAIKSRCHELKLRRTTGGRVYWLRIAHLHFAKREAEMKLLVKDDDGCLMFSCDTEKNSDCVCPSRDGVPTVLEAVLEAVDFLKIEALATAVPSAPK